MMRWILLSGLFLPAAAYPVGPADLLPSVEDTRAELMSVCDEVRAGTNPYFGRQMADRLGLELEKERSGAIDASANRRIELRARLAHELLRLGDPEGAVRLLEEALEISVTDEVDEQIMIALIEDLGLAWLRLAENQNCVALHTPASCTLPIREEGVHDLAEPSRRSAEQFLRSLENRPEEIQTRWLLNLTRMLSGDYPDGIPETLRLPDGALDSGYDFPHWENRAIELGVNVIDLAGGAVMDDFDGDGFLDLISSTWDPCGSLRAFRNSGDGAFTDVTREWGLDGQLGGLNLVHADYDNDGDLDLLVLRGGWLGQDGKVRNSLLRNDLGDERGRFVDVTALAGLAFPAYPTQTAAWADIDGDGDLDLYVGNESSAGEVYSWSLVENPGRAFPSQLFRNNGDGTFTDVARIAGVTNMRYAKGVAWGDYDDDGDPDLYVSNLGPNRLYRNDGAGEDGNVRFTDVAPELGVTGPEQASFATWFFDYDNDGDLDLYVNDYSARVPRVSASYMGLTEKDEPGHPVLYRNDIDGDGVRTFLDVSRGSGLDRPLLPMGANYGDLDNDGWLDIVLGTGVPDLEALMPDVAYRNDEGGGFVDVTFASGFGSFQKGHGVAFGDIDNDGDQDLFRQMGGAYPSDAFANALYENPTRARSWITLRFEGVESNRFAVGGRVAIDVRSGEEKRTIHLLVGSGGSFGGSSMQQEIGLGDAEAVDSVTIRWPGSGAVQRFDSLEIDRAYLLIEGEDEPTALELRSFALGSSDRLPAIEPERTPIESHH